MALKATAFSFRSLLGSSCPKRNRETWIVRCSTSSSSGWSPSFLCGTSSFPRLNHSNPTSPCPTHSPAATEINSVHRRGNLQQLCGTSTPLVTVDNIFSLEPYIVSHHIREGKGQKKAPPTAVMTATGCLQLSFSDS